MANSVQDVGNGVNSVTGAYNVLQLGWTANGSGSQVTQAQPILPAGTNPDNE